MNRRTFEPLEFSADGNRSETPCWNSCPEDRNTVVGLMRKARFSVLGESEAPYAYANSVVEVGTWAGATSLLLSDEGFIVYCVDHWKGGTDATSLIAEELGPKAVFQTFCRNARDRLFRKVVPCVGHSRTWAEIWPFQVAGVFIDADHEYQAVNEDIQLWWPHVRPGGVMCGHDFTLFDGVKRAVQEWRESRPYLEHGDSGEVWWTWKLDGKPCTENTGLNCTTEGIRARKFPVPQPLHFL